MKIYLAARYSRREELCGYRDQLEAAGHTVTSRWLTGAHEWSDAAQATEAAIETLPMAAQRFALEDIADIEAAALLVAFTERPRSGHSRGGRHVELGYAVGRLKPVWIVGPRENVFCALPGMRRYDTFEALLAKLEAAP